MRRRRFLIGLLAVPVVPAVWYASRNRVVVANESGQLVRSLTVEVCGQTIPFGDLTPGQVVSSRFGTPANESTFTVNGCLGDGTVIHDDCGYVVWEEYGERFHLTIRPGGEIDCRHGS